MLDIGRGSPAGQRDAVARRLNQIVRDLVGAAAGDRDARALNHVGVDRDIAGGIDVDAAQQLQAAKGNVVGGNRRYGAESRDGIWSGDDRYARTADREAAVDAGVHDDHVAGVQRVGAEDLRDGDCRRRRR